MGTKTLKFNDVEVNKKEFHASKQPIALNLVDLNQIIISGEFKHSDKGFKYLVGYANDDIITPLSIVLPQLKGYIKCFNNNGKQMSFNIEDDSVLIEYNDIWKKNLKNVRHEI